MRRITPYKLWLGHAGDARNYRKIYEAEIRALILLAHEEAPDSLPRDLIVIRIPLLDGSCNDPKLIQLAITTIVSLIESEVETLVTCSAGLSRSPSIVAAAIATFEASDPIKSLQRVTSGFSTDVSPSLWNQVIHVLRSTID